MGTIPRTIFDIPMDQLQEMDDIFGNLTRIDMHHIPKKFSDAIGRTKKKSMEQLTPACVYQSVRIKGIADDVVDLDNDTVIRGLLPPMLLKDSFEALFFVVTLKEYQRLDVDLENMVDTYFLDAWCSAMIETAGIWLCRHIEGSLSEQELYVTVSWCPGQHQFPLENQKTIFTTLKPKDIQVDLMDSYLMHPVKSLSGMMGLSTQKDERNLVACQFCDLIENCPSRRKDNCCTVTKTSSAAVTHQHQER